MACMARTLCMIPLARTVLSLVCLLSGCLSLLSSGIENAHRGRRNSIRSPDNPHRWSQSPDSGGRAIHPLLRFTLRIDGIGSFRWIEASPHGACGPTCYPSPSLISFPIAEQFAGSIFDLNADDGYEVKLLISEGDGRRTLRTGTIHTRAEPPDNPANPHMVPEIQTGLWLRHSLTQTLETSLRSEPVHIHGRLPLIVTGRWRIRSSSEGRALIAPSLKQSAHRTVS